MRHALASVLLCWAAVASPVKVVDGDTFDADVRVWIGVTHRERIRVLGVNTPELKGATREAAQAARAFTAEWLAGSEVRLYVCQRDAFGRLLATVTRARDGANLTEALLTSGHGIKR
jgi:micrococcal nuclease